MLDGRCVIVAGGDTAFGAALAAGLGDAGATVAVTTSRFRSGADARRGFAAFAPLDVLVHVPFDTDALIRETLVETDEDDWMTRGEQVLSSAVWSCQAAHGLMLERGGGRIVLVMPTAGLVGGAERVPLAMAAEGMRALAKVAARQWGGIGITVNCVAVAIDPSEGGPLPPALGRAMDTRHDVAGAVALLAGEDAGSITGVTVPVDGGVVML